MADFESHLKRWQSAGLLGSVEAERIRAWEAEQKQPAGLRWQGIVALILGAILLASGIVLFVSAHWDELAPSGRLALVLAMVAVFHVAGAALRGTHAALASTLHAVGTVAAGAGIALVGQIFNIEEHWPAAVLLWAVAAVAGWLLVRDEAQQTLALLLIPAWMVSELIYDTERHIGQDVYIGRLLFTWAVLYLTVFLGSQRKAMQGILFAVAAIAGIIGTAMMLVSWHAWSEQWFVSLPVRVWAWIAIAALPLLLALFRFGKSMLPVAASVVFVLVLPWCNRTWQSTTGWGSYQRPYVESAPDLAAYALVALFTVFLMYWGVRQASKALVNLGIVGFALTVLWFYFGDIMDKFGRSLGLIGVGILFLGGGWALEKMRRRLMAQMGAKAQAEAAR